MSAPLAESDALAGFGVWDRAAPKGRYLILREWRDSKTVQVGT